VNEYNSAVDSRLRACTTGTAYRIHIDITFGASIGISMSRRGGRGGGHSRSSVAVSKELLKRSASEAGLDDRHLKVLSDITRPQLYPDFLWHSTGKYWNEEEASNKEGFRSGAAAVQLSPTKRPASMISLIKKHRELTKRFQNGPHFVRPTVVIDIVRHCDREKHANSLSSPDSLVLASFSKSNCLFASDQRYFPSELLNGHEKSGKRKKLSTTSTTGSSTDPELTSTIFSKGTVTHRGVNDAVVTKLEKMVHEETSTSAVASGKAIGLARPTGTTIASSETAPDTNDCDEDEDELAPLNEDEEEGEDYTTNYYNTDDESDNGHDGEPTY
jgi:hypothetical protein